MICPTVLADNSHTFREQLERVEPFSQRIQVDLMDGIFAPSISLDIGKVWLPEKVTADIHLMYQQPEKSLSDLIKLKPHMVIVHAESEADVPKFAAILRDKGIKCGLAVLPDTSIQSVDYLLPHIHHLLIFGGKLGYFGGQADLSQLIKASQAKRRHKWLEIGWDGGVNDSNVRQIKEAGVDIINAGGYIQKSDDPKGSFDRLSKLIA